MLDILTGARAGVGDPDMVGDELAKARAELRVLYATWAEAAKDGPIVPPSGPEFDWLALRSAATMPALLDTITFLRHALARIARGEQAMPAELESSPWDDTSEFGQAAAIASMARRLTGGE